MSNKAFSERPPPLVLDTSVAINLVCTNEARRIIELLTPRVVLPARVLAELREGRSYGYNQADCIEDLIDEKLIDVAALDGPALDEFLALVGGTSTASLGDGEAATIAIAASTQSVAVIDERKARGILRSRYASTNTVMTMDLLLRDELLEDLGETVVAEVGLKAIQDGRMNIRHDHYDWLIERVDCTSLNACASIRRLARARS